MITLTAMVKSYLTSSFLYSGTDSEPTSWLYRIISVHLQMISCLSSSSSMRFRQPSQDVLAVLAEACAHSEN